MDQLTKDRNAVQDQLDALLKNDSLTAEQRTECDGLEAEWDRLSAEIETAKQLAAEDAERRAKHAKRVQSQGSGVGRKTQVDAPAELAPTNTSIIVKEPEKFASLGEQLQAIAGAAMSGREDNRLHWESLAPATGAAVAGVPSDGGYLIQKDFSTELLGRMNEIGAVKSLVNTVQISPNSDGLRCLAVEETSRATGSRWGGVQVYWGAEADAAAAKKPKFRQMELELKDLIGLAYVTNRLLQDASAVQSIFSQAFSEEMSFMIEDSLINGDGAGKPLGIMSSPALVTVAKESSQTAATINYANIVKMHARLWARSRKSAVWLVNQDAEPQIDQLFHATGTGGIPANFIRTSESGVTLIKGIPVVPHESCATLGIVGDIILADFSQVVAIEKGGLQAESSIHVRFTTNENTFRFIYRYDAQPVWNSALTPFRGSNTQSPFIALQTRS